MSGAPFRGLLGEPLIVPAFVEWQRPGFPKCEAFWPMDLRTGRRLRGERLEPFASWGECELECLRLEEQQREADKQAQEEAEKAGRQWPPERFDEEPAPRAEGGAL